MIPLLHVDAFTSCQYAGNPGGVCILPRMADPAWMQSVAAEMNLAETAFVVRRGEGAFELRWFTPTVEVPLCGHATLAAAHAIWERGIEAVDRTLTFSTASGVLRASRLESGWIELDFPVIRPEAMGRGSARWAEAVALAAALGVDIVDAAVSGPYWVLLAGSAAEVRAARPDFAAIARLGEMAILTAAADGVLPGTATLPPGVAAADFVSRVFVPAWGIPEDPVTGSAHCALAPFWANRLGRSEMAGFQASARGGVVGVRLAGDRVHLAGQAVTTIEGELRG
jgi:PhzF family phenazine biosynthesis protein